MEGKRQKQILPIILNRDIIELEALILATQALTFRFQKKMDLELKQLWFVFCKIQTTLFPFSLSLSFFFSL